MYGTIGNVELELSGQRAMFADPASKQSGHPVSYGFPVAGTVSGILSSIYWHPTGENFRWDVNRIRVMNKITFESIRNRYERYSKTGCYRKTILVSQTYLKDVRYQVQAQYKTWTGKDQDESLIIKAENIFTRRLKNKDPYYPLYLGRAECLARMNDNRFGSGYGYYDHSGEIMLSESAFIGFKYPADGYNGVKLACYAPIKMVDGVITFPSLNEATYTKEIKEF